MNNIFLISLLLTVIHCIQVPKTTDRNPELDSAEVEGYRFHIKTTGKKGNPLIVVIHGGPGGDYQYLSNLDELSNEFQLLFYDQRMTGLSPRKSNKELGTEQDLTDLHDIIKKSFYWVILMEECWQQDLFRDILI